MIINDYYTSFLSHQRFEILSKIHTQYLWLPYETIYMCIYKCLMGIDFILQKRAIKLHFSILMKDYIRTIYAPIAEDFRLETYQVENVARRNFGWVETSGGWECLALSCILPYKNGVGLLVAKVTGIFHCTFSISQCNKLASFTCRACTK